jgi:hypothetical protein
MTTNLDSRSPGATGSDKPCPYGCYGRDQPCPYILHLFVMQSDTTLHYDVTEVEMSAQDICSA